MTKIRRVIGHDFGCSSILDDGWAWSSSTHDRANRSDHRCSARSWWWSKNPMIEADWADHSRAKLDHDLIVPITDEELWWSRWKWDSWYIRDTYIQTDPITTRRIRTAANFPLNLNQHPKPILLLRLTTIYRKSIPLGGNYQVKDQHPWLSLSAPWRPSSILPTDIAINYLKKIGTENTDGTLSNRGKHLRSTLAIKSRHIAWGKFSGRLPLTCFPPSPIASDLVGETSGGVVYARISFVEDMISLLSHHL